jgi:hypothetical protein
MPELDISASADEVVALLQQGQAPAAAARLDTLRQEQSTVVQEALDRYIAVRAEAQLTALRQPGGIPAADSGILQPLLDRTAAATRPPRFPDMSETRNLSQAQQYDVYASIVLTRGNAAAHSALDTQDRVILGLRNENRTTEARGRGVYDDRIAVLWTDTDGNRRTREFNTATTEPTAQYDHHAGSDGGRIYGDTGRHAAHLTTSAGYQNVLRRKIEGSDFNDDGVRDLGRLAEGTTEMLATTHPRDGKPEFSLRPTPRAVVTGALRVERDTNGDGWFDARDTQGVQNLNDTFKIHRGSGRNTDSAGCQTIGDDKYGDFVRNVRGTPGQTRWQYVLTSVAPGQALERDLIPALRPNPSDDPRHPSHPDNAMLSQISTHLRGLGGHHAEHAEAYSLTLLHEAKAKNLTGVDQVVTNNATSSRAAGETLFLVQGGDGDPAASRVSVSVAELVETSIDTSLRRLQQQAAQEPAPAPVEHIQQQAAPVRGH